MLPLTDGAVIEPSFTALADSFQGLMTSVENSLYRKQARGLQLEVALADVI